MSVNIVKPRRQHHTACPVADDRIGGNSLMADRANAERGGAPSTGGGGRADRPNSRIAAVDDWPTPTAVYPSDKWG
jgi:hypothetical protein